MRRREVDHQRRDQERVRERVLGSPHKAEQRQQHHPESDVDEVAEGRRYSYGGATTIIMRTSAQTSVLGGASDLSQNGYGLYTWVFNTWVFLIHGFF